MIGNLKVCPRCRKIFGARPGRKYCSRCSAEKTQAVELVEEAVRKYKKKGPDEIAAFTGVPFQQVIRVLNETGILGNFEHLPICARCQEAVAQTGSDFCANCRIELNDVFVRAANALRTRMGKRTTDHISLARQRMHLKSKHRDALALLTKMDFSELRRRAGKPERAGRKGSRGFWNP